jgi:hypothetical protein
MYYLNFVCGHLQLILEDVIFQTRLNSGYNMTALQLISVDR